MAYGGNIFRLSVQSTKLLPAKGLICIHKRRTIAELESVEVRNETACLSCEKQLKRNALNNHDYSTFKRCITYKSQRFLFSPRC